MTKPVVPPDVKTQAPEIDAILVAASFLDDMTNRNNHLPACSKCIGITLENALERISIAADHGAAYVEQVADITTSFVVGEKTCPFKNHEAE